MIDADALASVIAERERLGALVAIGEAVEQGGQIGARRLDRIGNGAGREAGQIAEAAAIGIFGREDRQAIGRRALLDWRGINGAAEASLAGTAEPRS